MVQQGLRDVVKSDKRRAELFSRHGDKGGQFEWKKFWRGSEDLRGCLAGLACRVRVVRPGA